ncbi:MAG TPA: hypothetical protein VLE43_17795, partial [Candidatus Saccharimonadia bacterium]|nr:hypothetical protein [Candidatus Saccharimonadia bacterium]
MDSPIVTKDTPPTALLGVWNGETGFDVCYSQSASHFSSLLTGLLGLNLNLARLGIWKLELQGVVIFIGDQPGMRQESQLLHPISGLQGVVEDPFSSVIQPVDLDGFVRMIDEGDFGFDVAVIGLDAGVLGR